MKIIATLLLIIAIPTFLIGHWISSYDGKRTIDEYLLITKDKLITNGQLTKAEEFENEIENNNKIKYVSGYTFEYTFYLPNGERIVSNGGQYGSLPLKKSIVDIPYEVEVEYLKNNPRVNRIKGLWSNNETIYNWFVRNILSGFISLCIFLILGFLYAKYSYKEYITSKNNSNRA